MWIRHFNHLSLVYSILTLAVALNVLINEYLGGDKCTHSHNLMVIFHLELITSRDPANCMLSGYTSCAYGLLHWKGVEQIIMTLLEPYEAADKTTFGDHWYHQHPGFALPSGALWRRLWPCKHKSLGFNAMTQCSIFGFPAPSVAPVATEIKPLFYIHVISALFIRSEMTG